MPELVHAEKIMEDKPDSALLLLEKMQPIDNVSDRERAIYFLLLTQAQDKNYITHTTDSLIQIAANYFESHNDVERTTLAYYYLGRVYSDMQEILQAQEYYLKALEIGEENNNKKLFIKIYNSLGRLYSFQNIFEMSRPMYQKALNLLLQNKDSSNLSFIYRNIARTYSTEQKSDSAIYYYKKALEYLTSKSSPSILNDLGNLYFKQKDFTNALHFLKEAKMSTSNEYELYPIYLSLGELFTKIGSLDSAQFYTLKSLESPNIYTQAGSLYILAQIEKDHPKLYQTYIENYIQLQDSIKEFSNVENICKVQGMFNYQRLAKQKAIFEKKANKRKIEIFQISIGFIFILIICFYFFKKEQYKKQAVLDAQYKKYRISQKHIESNIKQIRKLENDLSIGKKEVSEIQKQLHETRKLILEMENRQLVIKQGTIHLLEDDFHASSIYLKAHTENCQLSQSEWNELRELIDATYNGFTKRLQKICPRISPEELHICYLAKMGLPVKKIASIMNITSSGVSQCRRRLYKKLTEQPENAEKFDTFIADF